MRKTYLLLLALIITISFNSIAQDKGYVITQNNDTLKCYKVKTDFILGNVRYKVHEDDDFKTAKEDSIKEYKLSRDTSIHIAKVLDSGSKPEYVLLLELGKICLYVQYIYGYRNTKTTNWYVSKNNQPLVELKTNGLWATGGNRTDRKIVFETMINDHPEVASEYKAEDSFSFNTLRKYIRQYNQADKSQKK